VVVTIVIILLLVAYIFGRAGGKGRDVEMEDWERRARSSTMKKKKRGKKRRSGE
jgi:hypothetical protein